MADRIFLVGAVTRSDAFRHKVNTGFVEKQRCPFYSTSTAQTSVRLRSRRSCTVTSSVRLRIAKREEEEEQGDFRSSPRDKRPV